MRPDDLRRAIIATVCALRWLALPVPSGSAAEPPPPLEEPVIVEDAPDEAETGIDDAERGIDGAETGIDGVVFLSSGERLRGRVSLTEGRTLRVHDLRARRTHELELREIDSIRTVVEDERMEEAWAFEEGGSRKKVRLGGQYPLRSYRQEILLAGGQAIEGHCIAAVIWVAPDGPSSGGPGREERKVILPRSQKGKVGQTLEDLVYPESIQLGPAAGETAVGAPRAAKDLSTLEGRLAGLSAIVLVDRRTLIACRGKVRDDGSFSVEGLLPGEHLVFARRGDEVATGFPERSPLAEGDLAAIAERIRGLAEFFDARRIVSTAGPADAPWVLLELERSGGTTLTGEGGRSYRFRRWELWALRRTGGAGRPVEGPGGEVPPGEGTAGEWQISKRVYLDRAPYPPEAAMRPARYVRDPSYERLRIEEGKNRL